MTCVSLHRLSAALVVLTLAAPWTASAAPPVAPDESLTAGRFHLDIQGIDTSSAYVMSIDADPIEVDTHEIVQGDDPVWRQFTADKPRFGRARFTFRTNDSRLEQAVSTWLADTLLLGQQAQKTITISILDRRGRVARRYSLLGSLPLGFARGGSLELVNGPCRRCAESADLAELDVQIGSIRIDASAVAGQGSGGTALPGASSAPQDKFLRTAGFVVKIDDGTGPAGSDENWSKVSGGADVIETVESTTGPDGAPRFTPGKAFVSDLTLEGAVTSGRRALLQWLNDSAAGTGDGRATVTVAPIPCDPTEPCWHQYLRCAIVRFAIPRLIAGSLDVLEDLVVIRPERYGPR